MTDRATRKSVAYARVSSRHQADSGLGIAAQLDRCRGYAVAMGYLPCDDVTDAGVSGSVAPADRPGLSAALASLDEGRADVLIVATLSRLGRRTVDVLDLADRAEQQGWGLVVLDLSLDTTTPTGRLCLTVMVAVAELQREQIRAATRDALAVKRKQGARLGRPVSQATRAVLEMAADLRAQGLTLQQVADELNALQFRTVRGHEWSPSTVHRALKSLEIDQQAQDARATYESGQQ